MAITIDVREGQIKDMITSALTKEGNVVRSVVVSWSSDGDEPESLYLRVSVCMSAQNNAGTTQLILGKDGLEQLLKQEWARQGHNVVSLSFKTEPPPYWCANCMRRGLVATGVLFEPPPVQMARATHLKGPRADY